MKTSKDFLMVHFEPLETDNAARDLQVRFEESGEPNAKVEEQKIVVEEFMREHLDAIYALKDFESRQW